MFFPYVMSKWTYLKYFEIFKMATILRFRCVIEPEVVPELWLFQNLTYFLILWPSYETFLLQKL